MEKKTKGKPKIEKRSYAKIDTHFSILFFKTNLKQVLYNSKK